MESPPPPRGPPQLLYGISEKSRQLKKSASRAEVGERKGTSYSNSCNHLHLQTIVICNNGLKAHFLFPCLFGEVVLFYISLRARAFLSLQSPHQQAFTMSEVEDDDDVPYWISFLVQPNHVSLSPGSCLEAHWLLCKNSTLKGTTSRSA